MLPHATESLLAHARRTYRERRLALVDALARHGIAVEAPSGLSVWLPVNDETTTAQTLLAHGWALRSGTAFRLESPPGLRITTATLLPTEAPLLAQDIARALSGGPASQAA